jgi:predicted amidohydrolase YtcJ
VREEQLEAALAMGFRSGQGVPGDEHERYRDGWLKLFSDGALGSRTAALLEPYEPDDPAGPPPGGPLGMPLRSAEQLTRSAGRAAEHGIASSIHALGDGAVRTVLGVLEDLPRVPGVCHRVEHAQLLAAVDIERFGRAGIAASVQPSHLLSDAAAMRRSWGARTARAFPLADLDAAGALLPFGSDAPVEPADPWPGIAAAVTRRGPGWNEADAFHAEQAVPLARALRGACVDGPRSAGLVDQGHLGVSARADLLIVPATLFDAPADPEVLAATRPLATLLDGQIVHRAPELELE